MLAAEGVVPSYLRKNSFEPMGKRQPIILSYSILELFFRSFSFRVVSAVSKVLKTFANELNFTLQK